MKTIKRLENLKIIKLKNLNKLSVEVKTLKDEIDKTSILREKLINIYDNSNDLSNSKSISIWKEKNKFKNKIYGQISISENRIKFLNIELNRAKQKLGRAIQQKKLVEKKITTSSKELLDIIETKETNNMPAFKKH